MRHIVAREVYIYDDLARLQRADSAHRAMHIPLFEPQET